MSERMQEHLGSRDAQKPAEEAEEIWGRQIPAAATGGMIMRADFPDIGSIIIENQESFYVIGDGELDVLTVTEKDTGEKIETTMHEMFIRHVADGPPPKRAKATENDS